MSSRYGEIFQSTDQSKICIINIQFATSSAKNILRGRSGAVKVRMTANISPLVTHKVEVCRLYRQSLRWSFDWHSRNPDRYRASCIVFRREFERNRMEKDPRRVALLMDTARYILWKHKHPEPFIFPTAPGGVAFMRYQRFPPEVRTLQLYHTSKDN